MSNLNELIQTLGLNRKCEVCGGLVQTANICSECLLVVLDIMKRHQAAINAVHDEYQAKLKEVNFQFDKRRWEYKERRMTERAAEDDGSD